MDQGKQLLTYALKTCGALCTVKPTFERRGTDETDLKMIVVKLTVVRYFRNFAPTIQTYSFNSNGRLFMGEQTDHDSDGGEGRHRIFEDLTLFEAKGLILSIS